jgi:uncharacterized membrane protein YgdD (TMEM256/DUF423 family)
VWVRGRRRRRGTKAAPRLVKGVVKRNSHAKYFYSSALDLLVFCVDEWFWERALCERARARNQKRQGMSRSVWHVLAALSGASGVGAAAYGAHALPKRIAEDEAARAAEAAAAKRTFWRASASAPSTSPATTAAATKVELADREMREACFRRANQQHMYHALLMAAAPLARRPAVVGSLALAGSLSFCGSVYAVALTGERARGIAAPAGGFCLIGAWLALLL